MVLVALVGVETLLTITLGYLFWKRQLHRTFRMMGRYLALQACTAPIFLLFFEECERTHAMFWCAGYFLLSWAIYVANAIFLYFICIEVFRHALAAFPGLSRLGIVIFRWAAVVSVLVAFSTGSFAHAGIRIIPEIASRLMHSVSVLELCLLAFLCLSMNALQLSVRDLSFGLSLGFGLLSANDFIASTFVSRYSSLASAWQFVFEVINLLAFGVWIIYSLQPQKKRMPMMIPADSTIYRWNEIASALGHTGTKVAVPQPADGFFLSDVENVVEKVLARNMQKRESES
jgi:cyanate lyase